MILKKILAHILVSFLAFSAATGIYFVAFPPGSWSELWTVKVLEVPVILMSVVASLTIGLITGFASSLTEMQRKKLILEYLNDFSVDQDSPDDSFPDEWSDVFKKIDERKKQFQEQTMITQKLLTERVETQEKQVQEIISQERNRLARELHDSVSQQLFAASMLMSAINESSDEQNPTIGKQLKLVEGMIQQSQLEMRALLLHLRPVALHGKSLQEGIRELLQELEMKLPISIQWKVEDLELDRGVEDHLFRILQESVSNTLRHAKATKLEVLLIQRDQFIIMRVVDDGVGFKVDEAKSAGSYGLQNMEERAKEIGGMLKIVSLPGKGTRLEVKVPILTEKSKDKKDNQLENEEGF